MECACVCVGGIIRLEFPVNSENTSPSPTLFSLYHITVSLYHCLYTTVSIPLSLYHCLYTTVSIPLSLYHCLCTTVSLYHCVSISLALFPLISLSLSVPNFNVSSPYTHCLGVSLLYLITLSYFHVSLCLSSFLSFCLSLSFSSSFVSSVSMLSVLE